MRRLAELAGRNSAVREFVTENGAAFNGTPGDPRSFDRLDDLLARQCYRLSFWRVALDEINYRRFFDVNDLAALSAEREEVFDATHELIFRLIDEGKIDGLRIDHPDGLYDPREYFDRLRDRASRPLYVVVEKILGDGEPLPQDWPVAGTTGYEFLNAVNGLFVDSAAEGAFTRLYRDLLDDYDPFVQVVYRSKQLILDTALSGELNALAQQLDRLAQKRRASRDFTLNGLRDALREVIACFPVYRSYIAAAGATDADRAHVELAARRAAARNPMTSPAVFRFVRDTVLLDCPEGTTHEDRAEQLRFAGKFQQVTSPVMAKGLEDTAFYVYNRLVSLNEVGGNPGRFGTRSEALHAFLAARQRNWPRALSPLSTHDTKRSEDVRARINVLSEMPDEWSAAVRRWSEWNADRRGDRGRPGPPDANEEYLLYQTLVGAWPPGVTRPDENFADRIAEYMVKALHESKVHSSWINPNGAYDSATQAFVRRVLDPDQAGDFLADFVEFQKRVAWIGAINTLAQTLLKLTAPGVPDTYQGTELPDFSLVDPDNRRPVDYDKRRAVLADVRLAASREDRLADFARELLDSVHDGRAKLYVTWRGLAVRRDHPGLFAEGEYLPLATTGEKPVHAFAFARRFGGTTTLVALPRLVARLATDGKWSGAAWGDTFVELPPQGDANWRDSFTGRRLVSANGRLAAADVFSDYPVALLFGERGRTT